MFVGKRAEVRIIVRRSSVPLRLRLIAALFIFNFRVRRRNMAHDNMLITFA